MSIRRYATLILLTTGLLLAATAALNWLVDPYARYGTGLINPLVELPRREKYLLLRDMAPPPDILILGSSRAMRLSPALVEDLTGRTAFNAGVSRAMPLDYFVWSHFAIAGLAAPPELIVVCVDIQAMHPTVIWNNPDWLESSPLRAYAGPYQTTFSLEAFLTGLLSGSQAADSLQAVWRNLTTGDLGQPLYDAHGAILPDADGQLVEAPRVPFDDYAFWQSFDRIPQERFDNLRRLFDLTRDHDVALMIVLLPFDAEALAEMRQIDSFNRVYDTLRDFLREQQAVYGFAYHDLTDVDTFGGDPYGFDDYYHMSYANADRVVTALFGGGE